MFGSCRQVMGVSWRSERSSWASSGEEGVQWLKGHRTLQSQGHSHSLSESLNLWRTEAYTLTVFEAGMCQEHAATGLRSTEGYFLLPRKYPASSARAEDTEFSHGGRQRCTEKADLSAPPSATSAERSESPCKVGCSPPSSYSMWDLWVEYFR